MLIETEKFSFLENSIKIDYIVFITKESLNKESNMALVYDGYKNWHQKYPVQPLKTREKFTKN